MDETTQWILRLDWLLTLWLFALGGVVGSFLNVVVYRLPAHKSIVHPGSCCPACGHPIRWYHNLPVLSWLWLRGRCYDCGAKISPRYPLVELTVGLLFVALAAVEIWPVVDRLAAGDTVRPALAGFDILVRYGSHLWLLATLLCVALMEFDRQRVPRFFLPIAIAVGMVVTVGFPLTRLERLSNGDARLPANAAARLAAHGTAPLAEALLGFVAGLLAGWLANVALTWGTADPPERRRSVVRNTRLLELACVGTFLGSSAAVAVGIVATVVCLVGRRLVPAARRGGFDPWGFSATVLLATLVWIAAAQHWADWMYWGPGF